MIILHRPPFLWFGPGAGGREGEGGDQGGGGEAGARDPKAQKYISLSVSLSLSLACSRSKAERTSPPTAGDPVRQASSATRCEPSSLATDLNALTPQPHRTSQALPRLPVLTSPVPRACTPTTLKENKSPFRLNFKQLVSLLAPRALPLV